MADSKTDYIHQERSILDVPAGMGLRTESGIPQEVEPTTQYSTGWKTYAAIIALSFANCCAVITNTVSY